MAKFKTSFPEVKKPRPPFDRFKAMGYFWDIENMQIGYWAISYFNYYGA